MERWYQRKEKSLGERGRSTRGACRSEMVLESDEARAGFSKEKQEVDLKMVKAFILRPEGPRAAPVDLGLTLMKVE